jgi:hypothetical protein
VNFSGRRAATALREPSERAHRFAAAAGSPVARTAGFGTRKIVAGVVPSRDVVGDASREHERRGPIRIVQIVASNSTVSFARVDHRAVAFVDADVGHDRLPCAGREKHQVATLKPPRRLAEVRLVDGAPGRSTPKCE